MENSIKFNSFYNGQPVLVSNTPYTREEIIKHLLASDIGEWCPGYYRFTLLD